MLLRCGLFWMLILIATSISAQSEYNHKIELSTDLGYSGILGNPPEFHTFNFPSNFEVENLDWQYSRGFSFSYARRIKGIHALKASLGFANFSFYYDGYLPASQTPELIIKEVYKIRFLELGIAYSVRLKTFNFGSIQLELGPVLHTEAHRDARFSTQAIRIFHTDSFSFIGYIGYEIPMLADHFFVNFGLTFKLPLERHDYSFDNSIEPYRPFFMGIRVAVNYQF